MKNWTAQTHPNDANVGGGALDERNLRDCANIKGQRKLSFLFSVSKNADCTIERIPSPGGKVAFERRQR